VEQDAKRSRAENKEREDAKIIEGKLSEIARYESKLATLKAKLAQKTRQFDRTKENKIYLDHVLVKVREKEEQYNDIDELITRYEILHKTNLDLTERRAVVCIILFLSHYCQPTS
jgi:hypothetical protein